MITKLKIQYYFDKSHSFLLRVVCRYFGHKNTFYDDYGKLSCNRCRKHIY